MRGALLVVAALAAPLQDGPAEALRSPEAKTRRRAVQDLAERGDAESWELIFERGLSDRAPMVADEAQLKLGEATWSATLLELAESKNGLKSRDEVVRLRVVEALGRAEGAVDAELFVRGLKDKDPEVRAAAAYALEKRAREGPSSLAADGKSTKGLLTALARVASKDKVDRVRANAVAAIAPVTTALSAETDMGFVAGAALASESLVQVAGAFALAEAGDEQRSWLAEAIGFDDRAISTACVRLLADLGDREAMRTLAMRLGEEPLRPALRRRILRVLRAASGLSHGPNADRWLRWVDGLDDDWRAPEKGQKDEADDESGSTTFFGLRIVGDRVAFLVDMSGSMWSERGGKRRKDSVDLELETALRGLPETARFDLVPYAGEPAPWKGELVEASKKNVDRAIKAFRGSGLRGKGNLWDALIPVLRDPEVDTVVLLTDGAPTGGHRWNVDLMRTLLQDENRFRGVTIHVLLFDASKGLQRRWQGIADDNDGVLRVIDL